MKKIIMACVVAFLLVSLVFAFIIYQKSIPTKTYTDMTGLIEDDAHTYISVSAVGDCTLGVDINGLGTGCFDDEFEKSGRNFAHFFENVKPVFEKDDLTIVNFEGTLSYRGERQDKEYAFCGVPVYAKILHEGSVEAANLSNNHSMDYGEIALSDTRNYLEENGITSFGFGVYKTLDINGVKVGLISANLLRYDERVNFKDAIEKLKGENPDIIIGSFHWGEENVDKPTLDQIQFAHMAVDMGVDLVLGHHPHVLQGIEKYNGAYIAYSLGNFCFGGNRNPKDKDTVILSYTFCFKDGKRILDNESIDIIPCSISSVKERNDFKPTPLLGDEYDRVKKKVISLSDNLN